VVPAEPPRIFKAESEDTSMPPTLLTDDDFANAAQVLGCDVAAIHTVSDVESAGSGFLPAPDNRPKILFESHQFHLETVGKFDQSHPEISTPTWVRNYGAAGAHQYDRLEVAKSLDLAAAFSSASWGRYQIMGENHRLCGWDDVAEFVSDMYDSEANHLIAFTHYLQSTGIVADLAAHNWVSFALRYNGRGERANNYDGKLAADYIREHQKYLGAV
jgi:hypothetical protein